MLKGEKCNKSVQKDLLYLLHGSKDAFTATFLHLSLRSFCACKMAALSILVRKKEKHKKRRSMRQGTKRNFIWTDDKLQIISMLLTSIFASTDKEGGDMTPFLLSQFTLPPANGHRGKWKLCICISLPVLLVNPTENIKMLRHLFENKLHSSHSYYIFFFFPMTEGD